VLIPEKKFLRNINYLKVWTKTEGYVFVLSRDIERLKSLINEGESIITENVLLAITSSSKAVNNSFLSLML